MIKLVKPATDAQGYVLLDFNLKMQPKQRKPKTKSQNKIVTASSNQSVSSNGEYRQPAKNPIERKASVRSSISNTNQIFHIKSKVFHVYVLISSGVTLAIDYSKTIYNPL